MNFDSVGQKCTQIFLSLLKFIYILRLDEHPFLCIFLSCKSLFLSNKLTWRYELLATLKFCNKTEIAEYSYPQCGSKKNYSILFTECELWVFILVKINL